MKSQYKRLSHSVWLCKYHIILSQISIQDIGREDRSIRKEQFVPIMRAEGPGNDRRSKYTDRSCTFNNIDTAEVLGIRDDGIFEGEVSAKIVSRAERVDEAILGEAHMVTWVLRINGRTERREDKKIREVAART